MSRREDSGPRILASGFVISASAVTQVPPGDLPEIALVGRSNVGKSSLLNAMLGRHRLARVSRTPGRTRLLNFFNASVAQPGSGKRFELSICDLPGYGFAKASHRESHQWQVMTFNYLERRECLRGAVLLLDVRRTPSEEDHRVLGWLQERGRPVLPVVTKVDKLSKSQQWGALRAIEKALSLAPESALAVSAETGQGLPEFWNCLEELLV